MGMYTDKSTDSGSETRSEGPGSTVDAEWRGHEEAQWRNHSKQTIAVRAAVENTCWNQGIPKGLDRYAVKLKLVSDKEFSEP